METRLRAAPLGGGAHSPDPGETSPAEHFENVAETLATFITLASIQLAIRARF